MLEQEQPIELGAVGTAPDGSARQSAQGSPDDENARPRVAEHVRDALGALEGKPELNAAVTYERSKLFWAAVEPAKRELVERVARDQALDADAAETLNGIIDAYAEARLFRTSMFLRLVDLGGPITTKGKARALYTAYLSALDRETKLAQILGLERKRKPINPLDAVREAVAEANKR